MVFGTIKGEKMARLYAIFTKVSFGLGVCGLLWAGIFEDVPIKLILIGLIILFVLFFQGLAITDLSDKIRSLNIELVSLTSDIQYIDSKTESVENSDSDYESWVCHHCGHRNPSYKRFCIKCGK